MIDTWFSCIVDFLLRVWSKNKLMCGVAFINLLFWNKQISERFNQFCTAFKVRQRLFVFLFLKFWQLKRFCPWKNRKRSITSTCWLCFFFFLVFLKWMSSNYWKNILNFSLIKLVRMIFLFMRWLQYFKLYSQSTDCICESLKLCE